MLSPPGHSSGKRLLRPRHGLDEALRLISDAGDPAAADSILGVVAEQVDIAAEVVPFFVHRLQHLEQGQHVVDGAVTVLRLVLELVGDDCVGELVRVRAAVFVDRQAVQPVKPAGLEAPQQLPQEAGVKLRIMGDHQDGAGLHQFEEAADGGAGLHALRLEELVSDAGQGDDALRQRLALGQFDEGVQLAGDAQGPGGCALHAQGGQLDDLILGGVEAAGLCVEDDEGLVAVEKAGEVTHGTPPCRPAARRAYRPPRP